MSERQKLLSSPSFGAYLKCSLHARAAKLSISSSPPMFSIGNCKVEVDGNNVECKSSNPNDLQLSVTNTANIKISAVEGEKISSSSGYSFVLVNPKEVDSCTKFLIQEALRIYKKELPAMKYAANTGKKSLFLERCVSNGKYCTLLLTSNSMEESREVIAAVTYQIIPADTQHAEVPLAAVCSHYHHKGIGRLLYSELRTRLQNVGTRTIFCWGDKESEGFWVKQGFVPIAEIDTNGKARRLPIKADIQKTLCFPGGSTLMVSHLNKDKNILSNSLNHSKDHANSSSLPVKSREMVVAAEPCDISKSSFLKEGGAVNIPQIKNAQSQLVVKHGCPTGESVFKGQDCIELAPSDARDCDIIDNNVRPTEDRENAVENHCSHSKQGVKRKIWKTSCSSIKSKKVKGDHHIDCNLDSSRDMESKHHQGNNSCFAVGSLSTPKEVPEKSLQDTCLAIHTKESGPVHAGSEDHAPENLLPKGECHRIMLMNIADDVKKTFLTKIIEELGGAVTSDGCLSTHVVTGKVRKTLNFCTALCSGAWIVSTNWLKECSRKGKFVDESAFILEDNDYVLKFKSKLKDAVFRAKASPQALLKGYDFYLAKHVQPPGGILSAIVKSAGGNVIARLDKVREPSRTIFIACEEDMVEAMLAAKKGVWIYSGDWLINCLMRQELDLCAPQFAESL